MERTPYDQPRTVWERITFPRLRKAYLQGIEAQASRAASARQSIAAELIAVERERQVVEKGFTPAGDRGFGLEIARAAYSYAEMAASQQMNPRLSIAGQLIPPSMWPWDDDLWHPEVCDPTRNLIKAGALAAAAADSLMYDRTELGKPGLLTPIELLDRRRIAARGDDRWDQV